MRAILLILILAVVAILIGLGTGLVDIDQTRGAKAPDIDTSRNGVTASGGQTPAFDIETGSVEVGTKQTNVSMPTIEVQRADNANQAATNTVTP